MKDWILSFQERSHQNIITRYLNMDAIIEWLDKEQQSFVEKILVMKQYLVRVVEIQYQRNKIKECWLGQTWTKQQIVKNSLLYYVRRIVLVYLKQHSIHIL